MLGFAREGLALLPCVDVDESRSCTTISVCLSDSIPHTASCPTPRVYAHLHPMTSHCTPCRLLRGYCSKTGMMGASPTTLCRPSAQVRQSLAQQLL